MPTAAFQWDFFWLKRRQSPVPLRPLSPHLGREVAFFALFFYFPYFFVKFSDKT
jgi:hypothetical protein